MILPTPDEILKKFRGAPLSPAEKRAQMKILLTSQIAGIDALISRQLAEIIHHPEFRALEAAWRGLHYLVNETCPNERLRIKVLTASKRELLKDFERSLELNQSCLYRRIYDDVFGTFGEDPYGLLIGDYEFSNHPQDIALLERMAMLASAVKAPLISGAHPQLFGAETFSAVCEKRDLREIFVRTEYLKWNQFRDSEDSRYVGLCLPHILLREPHAQFSNASFSFQESAQPETLLWGNAAYAFGACVAKAYRESGWCGMMTGSDSDGAVEGLPTYEINRSQQSVEAWIDGWREKQFSDLGFLPLMQNFGRHRTAFFSARSCMKARRYDNERANIDARLKMELPYALAMSRFAHYLMAMVRDRSQPFENRQQCERELNKWLGQYFHSAGEIGDELRARFPLSDCRVNIAESPDNLGELRGIAFLSPEYQLEELSYSMRMVFDLPKAIGEVNLKPFLQTLNPLALKKWTVIKIEFNSGKESAPGKEIATRQSWRNLQSLPPVRKELSISRTFTKQEFLKIRLGHIPKDPDDKWFVFFDDWKLYFHRSSTGFCLYELEFAESGNQYTIKRALANRESSQNLETKDDFETSRLSRLIDTLLLENSAHLFNPDQLLLEGAETSKPFIEFNFEKGLVEGFGSCNYFSAAFEIDGSKLKFSEIKPLGHVDLAHFSDELKNLQGGFLNKLRNTTRFELQATRLKFFADEELLATFEASGPTAA